VTFFVAFLIVAFAIGGTPLGRWSRRHPFIVVAASTLAAASFYSLRVAT
jgi:hypothetical protein